MQKAFSAILEPKEETKPVVDSLLIKPIGKFRNKMERRTVRLEMQEKQDYVQHQQKGQV